MELDGFIVLVENDLKNDNNNFQAPAGNGVQ